MMKTRMSVAAAAVLSLVALSACGAGEKSAGEKTGTDLSSAKGNVSAAKELLSKYAGTPEFISPGGPVDVKPFAGKTIVMVTLNGGLPFIEATFAGMREAAKAAGVKVQMFAADGSTSIASQKIEQAVAAGAMAIVPMAVNLKYIPEAVAAAKKAGVPIVGTLNVDSGEPMETNAAGEVSIDYVESGRLLAAYAVAHTDGPVHAQYQNLAGIETFESLAQGLDAGVKEFCTADCTLESTDLNPNNLRSDAEQSTTSSLARNPKLNWIFAAIDGIAQFSIPGVELAGKQDSVSMGSINAVSANLDFIKQKRVQTVDVGNSNNWLGWAMVDRAMRAAAGEAPTMSKVPIRLFDASNVKDVDTTDEDAVFGNPSYRDGYTSLWNK